MASKCQWVVQAAARHIEACGSDMDEDDDDYCYYHQFIWEKAKTSFEEPNQPKPKSSSIDFSILGTI